MKINTENNTVSLDEEELLFIELFRELSPEEKEIVKNALLELAEDDVQKH